MIGVIGGAGVAATNLLAQLVEESYIRNGAIRDADQPEIIIWQATKTHSRSMYYEGRGPSFVNQYMEIGKRLVALGAETLCMCCNTAHAALDELKAEIHVEFIDLVSEVVAKAKKDKNSNNFILVASDGCIKSGVYQKVFARDFPEANLILPTPDIQKMISNGICNVKNANRFLPAEHPDSPANIFQNVFALMRSAITPAPSLILGCTDIRVAYKIKNETEGIDSLETLAKCIFSRSLKAI